MPEGPIEKPMEKNGNGWMPAAFDVLVEHYRDIDPVKTALIHTAYKNKNKILLREYAKELKMEEEQKERTKRNGEIVNEPEETANVSFQELLSAEAEEDAEDREERKKIKENGYATMPRELALVDINPELKNKETEENGQEKENLFEKSYHLLSQYYHTDVPGTGNANKMALINMAYKDENRQTIYAYVKELKTVMAMRRKMEEIKEQKRISKADTNIEDLLEPIETKAGSEAEELSVKVDSNLEDLFEPIEAGTPEKIMAERNAESTVKMAEKLKAAWSKKEELLPEIKKQQGLAYRLGISRSNPEIQREYDAACKSYDEALDYLEFLTDKSREDIEAEYLGTEKAVEVEPKLELVKEFLTEKMGELNGQVERLKAGERAAYEKIKKLAAEKGMQTAIGLAISGVVLAAPPTGFIEMVTMGISTGVLPAALGAKVAIASGIGGGYLVGRGGLTNFVNSLKSRGVTQIDLSKSSNA